MKKLLERWSRAYRVARRFSGELRAEQRRLFGAVVLLLGVVALELLRPWPLQWLIDHVLLDSADMRSEARAVWIAAGVMLGILVGRALLDYAATLLVTSIGHGVARAIRLRVFKHLVDLSPAFHARHKSGDLIVRLMGDVPMVKDMLVDGSVQLFVRIAQVVGTVAVMTALDARLTLIALGPVPVILVVVRFLSERLRVATKKQRRKEGELADYLHEAVSATTLVQSLGRERHVVRRFARSNRKTARAGLKAARAAAGLGASVEALLGLGFAAALAFGSLRVLDGALTTGELVAFLSLLRSLSKPVRSAGKNQARIAKGTACGERLLGVLDEAVELRRVPGRRAAPEAPRELAFERVSFRYPDGGKALDGLDVVFRRGELTALVGPNGAGKSTLAALALRIHDPRDGRVTLDGVGLPEYDLDGLRERFGLAMQQNVLFGESVAENLLLGRPEASEEELWGALEAAGVADVVRGMPEGLDTTLGAAGVGLSGGQARRVCLARALLRGAPILIVDEPLSGLDSAAATAVAATLRAYSRERIVIVITHELERLGEFDRVVRIERGRVVQDAQSGAGGGLSPTVEEALL